MDTHNFPLKWLTLDDLFLKLVNYEASRVTLSSMGQPAFLVLDKEINARYNRGGTPSTKILLEKELTSTENVFELAFQLMKDSPKDTLLDFLDLGYVNLVFPFVDEEYGSFSIDFFYLDDGDEDEESSALLGIAKDIK